MDIQEEFERNLRTLTEEIKRKANHADYEDKPVKKKTIMKKIEGVILDVVESVQKGKPLRLDVKNFRDWDNCTYADRLILKPDKEVTTCKVVFDSERSQRKYTIIVHLLSKIYQMLNQGLTSTRRELYYKDVELLQSQDIVDEAIKIICCLLNTPPWQLGVFGTSKGLVAGHLVLQTNTKDTIDCLSPGGVLIPQDVLSLKPVSKAKFILIVEKDATFQTLLDEKILDRYKLILITGKGFPDLNTRLLVRLLTNTLKIPVFMIADADPHGMEIMCVYRYGSLTMSEHAQMLAVPEIHWLGVHPSDIEILHLTKIPFTTADEDKLNSLASRVYTLANTKLVKEISILKKLNSKAEIESVSSLAKNNLTNFYIEFKIAANQLI
nr:PREDICTED: meiotic recombination protein SPO11 isoform X1 [Bemisia tabaci]